MSTRLEALQKQRADIDRKLRDLTSKQARLRSVNEKRQKIILGGWLMKHRPELVNNIVENGLEREQDRRAFAGWTPLPPLHSDG
jgi:hypothetical protein